MFFYLVGLSFIIFIIRTETVSSLNLSKEGERKEEEDEEKWQKKEYDIWARDDGVQWVGETNWKFCFIPS